MRKESVVYKGVIDFDEIETGSLTHLIKTGVEAEFGKAQYKESEKLYFVTGILDTSARGDYEGIIDGEQWAQRKTVYKAMDNKKSYTTAALFLEDSVKVDRYTLRPGVRVSTDTVTDNTDIAPRFYANADIFDDRVWNVYGGYNRYYGGLILHNAIYEHHRDLYIRTAYDAPWTVYVDSFNLNYSLDGIKTPYSDEFSIGTSLAKWDTLFKLDFVKREFKDQLKQKLKSLGVVSGVSRSEYINTNEGRSDYWGVTLTASKEYELGNTKHFSEFSVTNSEASNNLNGLNAFSTDDAYSSTHITYDGELKKYEDVPSPDYNSPWVITYTHIMSVSDFLSVGLNARYEKGVDGYRYKDNSGQTAPDGKGTRNYESKHYGDTFTVDLSANYDLKFGENKLSFGVEVLNLLNRKNDTSYSSTSSNIDGYAMGRQFYANLKYEY